MPCSKCGGVLGPHSDMCLDCGHDPYESSDRIISIIWVSLVFAMGIALVLVPLLSLFK